MGRPARLRKSAEMTPHPPLVRFCAVAAPVLLLCYGLLRWVDGRDGQHGPGLAWNVGHTLFFAAFVLLGVLVAAIRPVVVRAAPGQRVIAGVATVAALFGAACFLWVILGDLFAGFHDAVPLPDALELLGPILFQLGALTLLIELVVARPRRLPVWAPIAVLVGFGAIGANLDLLPVGAVLIGVGLAPLAVTIRPAVDEIVH
jgi:hypothetical protein